MAEFMRANANVLKVLKKFKFTEAKDGKRYAFAQELVQKLLTVAPDHADFANTFSNMVEKHANAWRNNEATSVLYESLYLWMKHYKSPIHRSILIQIELDTGANRKLLMNNGNTRLFTTASNWLFKGYDFSLDIHAFQPLISCKTKQMIGSPAVHEGVTCKWTDALTVNFSSASHHYDTSHGLGYRTQDELYANLKHENPS